MCFVRGCGNFAVDGSRPSDATAGPMTKMKIQAFLQNVTWLSSFKGSAPPKSGRSGLLFAERPYDYRGIFAYLGYDRDPCTVRMIMAQQT